MAHNDKDQQAAPGPEARDEVIDRLYEVAIDPARYEELLDRWEHMIRPARLQGRGDLQAVVDEDFAPHFERADKFLDRMAEGAAQNAQSSPLAHIDKSAAFLVGRELRVVDVNKAGAAVLGIAKGSKLSALAIEDADLHQLEKQICALLTGNSDQSAVFRARSVRTERLVVIQLRVLRWSDMPPLVLAVTSEIQWPEGFSAVLRSAFGLTNAEADVVRALTQCHTLREISDARGRSVDTVRAQLRSVFAKTETGSQTELVRLVLSMMDITAYTEGAAATSPRASVGSGTLEPRTFHALTLPDGRLMEYLVLGDPAGRPCLYLPLDYGLVRWPASAEAEAARHGIRIIVGIRPGYGNSSPLQRGSDYSRIIANDHLMLLDHLGVKKCPVISLGGDFHFSAHLFDRDPGRFTAMIACAGVLPLDRPEQYERMDKWHRFILAGARYTPHLLPFMVKAGFYLARKLGKAGFIHAVYGNSDADVKTFENPEVFEAMTCGSEVALSDDHSAHRAFSNEVITQETVDWSGYVRAMEGRVPVHFLNGLHDPQVPPETLREHQRDYPWIEFAEYDDAGQLIFFLKWREVLNLLVKYL